MLEQIDLHVFLPIAYQDSCFLNQVRAGRRLARAWFLKINPVQIVGMSVCVCLYVCVFVPEAINKQWHDVALYGPHTFG